jgi:AcrR family transcriptional regulator
MREVVKTAGVNVAAAHYHFGSKQALFEQVFESSASEVRELTMKMLAEAKQQKGSAKVLESVIRALVVPSFEASDKNHANYRKGEYGRLRAHLFLEQAAFANKLFKKFYADIFEESLKIIKEIMPQLTDAELAWRYHVLVATLVFSTIPAGRVHAINSEAYAPEDSAEAIRQIVPLLTHLFSARTT